MNSCDWQTTPKKGCKRVGGIGKKWEMFDMALEGDVLTPKLLDRLKTTRQESFQCPCRVIVSVYDLACIPSTGLSVTFCKASLK